VVSRCEWVGAIGGFGVVVRAADWHAGDPGLILGRDRLNTFGYIPRALSLLQRRYCTV
jgi:hypothetical protein